MEPDYNSRDLRLHRKYILVICFVLVFLKYGGIKLEHIEFLGASFRITNVNAIYVGLWSILGYSVIRYYQYFRSQAWGHFVTEFRLMQVSNYQGTLNKIIGKAIAPNQLSPIIPGGAMQVPPQYFQAPKTSWWEHAFSGQLYLIRPAEKEGAVHVGSTPSQEHVTFKYHFIKDFWRQTLKTAFAFVFHTPYFFEYIVPLVLVFGTIGYYSWSA